MSENGQRLIARCWQGLVLGMVWLAFLTVPPSWGNPPAPARVRLPGGASPVVVLSGEFFQAMDKFANSGTVYGDRQELFLEQIATAQRFVVKTNLALLEQNERIIRLLEDLRRQGQRENR
jgi:hypothetical protein